MKYYPGINIQWPISELILNGEKTIETRTYPIPEKYLNQEMLLIETPGKKGNFKARIRGIVLFTNCFLYQSKTQFYRDAKKHHVSPESQWAWEDKPKWGWEVSVLVKFDEPIAPPANKGIRFTKQLKLKLPSRLPRNDQRQ